MNLLAWLATILFVSPFGAVNDLAPQIEAGLRAQGQSATVITETIPGAPLRYLWENPGEAATVRAALAEGRGDVLVLGELDASEPQSSALSVAAYGELARGANPDVRLFLTEGWPAPSDDPAAWRAGVAGQAGRWQAMADAASARIGGAAVAVVPAGQALLRLEAALTAGEVPGVFAEYLGADGKPTARGLYYLALVHVAAISGQSPEGLPARFTRSWASRDAVISEDLAAALQRLAWAAVEGAEAGRIAPVAESVALAAALPAPDLPVPAPAVAPPGLTGVANPNLGFGLAAVTDYTVQQPFLDIMKTARTWTGHLPGKWGGWEHADLAAGGWLDANGWPKAMPPEVTGLSTLFLVGLPVDAGGMAGRYLLTYDGQGDIRLEGLAQGIVKAPGRITFDFVPGDGAVVLTLDRIDPANPVRNIVVVREDRAALLAAGQIFNPDWLARLRGVKLLRFMDWMAANTTTLARVEDRPKPSDYTYTRLGVPMEVMIALCNELRADGWFNLPHLADDGLVRHYAQMARDGLAPGVRAYVELSNEVWNFQFPQAHWMEDQALARWGDGGARMQFYALRAAEMFDIWTEVYGPEAKARLVRVIATQTGWLGLENDMIDAPRVRAEGRVPLESFDAYAVTGYFSALLGDERKLAAVRAWVAESLDAAKAGAAGLTGAEATAYVATHRYDLARTRAAQELRDGSLTGNDEDTLARLFNVLLRHQAEIARKNGLQLVMYEGGTHIVGYGAQTDDAALTDFFVNLNYSAEMGALYAELLAGWAAITDAPFMAYVDVYVPNRYGSWGALRQLWDNSPRWQALTAGCAAC